MKCDLHVHSVHSGMCTIPLLRHFIRECYTEPGELYARLKARGMDLVTVTDHDSIAAGESLCAHADFFLSEEVTVRTPDGTELHLGVYDISQRQHIEIQRRRNDVPTLVAYLAEQRLLFSVNHLFSGLTGRRTPQDFAFVTSHVPAMEVRNGHMLAAANRAAEHLCRARGLAPLAGSDAHVLASAGSAWTQVPGARSKREFLDGIAAARGLACGAHGSYFKLTRDIHHIGGRLINEHPLALLLAIPGVFIVPFWTLANYAAEFFFARHWRHRLALPPLFAPAPARQSASAEAWRRAAAYSEIAA